jgi:hypothetical protein
MVPVSGSTSARFTRHETEHAWCPVAGASAPVPAPSCKRQMSRPHVRAERVPRVRAGVEAGAVRFETRLVSCTDIPSGSGQPPDDSGRGTGRRLAEAEVTAPGQHSWPASGCRWGAHGRSRVETMSLGWRGSPRSWALGTTTACARNRTAVRLDAMPERGGCHDLCRPHRTRPLRAAHSVVALQDPVTCAGAHDPKPQYRVVRIVRCSGCISGSDTSPADDPIRKRHQDL